MIFELVPDVRRATAQVTIRQKVDGDKDINIYVKVPGEEEQIVAFFTNDPGEREGELVIYEDTLRQMNISLRVEDV